MSEQTPGQRHAACVEAGEPPLTRTDLTVIVIVLVLAVALALTGMPSLSVFVLLAEATSTGCRLARRLRARTATTAS
ncbi:hypothetical protein [Streptomyces sp. SAJ15]|uniref:hypothetical protein n=1 Tax=Streptomyces sp. SAJ15 TaxID=2011095 RepID=UPI001185B291|nr:hypothetical protein [Streptomyces sp. SAJ15]TVL88496.1 hypothetical protein CD790_31150 [Streptomyces sp. SAJ15]